MHTEFNCRNFIRLKRNKIPVVELILHMSVLLHFRVSPIMYIICILLSEVCLT